MSEIHVLWPQLVPADKIMKCSKMEKALSVNGTCTCTPFWHSGLGPITRSYHSVSQSSAGLVTKQLGKSLSTSLVNDGKNPPSCLGVLVINSLIQTVVPGDQIEKSYKNGKNRQ